MQVKTNIYYLFLYSFNFSFFNMLYVSRFFKCVWICHPKLLLKIFAKSCMVDGFMSGQIFSWGHLQFCHVPLPCMGLSVSLMKAKVQLIDFRYCHFELTCWSTYSNHKKQLMYIYLLDIFLTGELYVSLPRMNTCSSTSSASHTNKSWSLISFMISAGNHWTSQAALTI